MDVKVCQKCTQQARCADSRQCKGYVRRRYVCQCGERWTTTETRGEPLPRDGDRWRYFRDFMDESHKLRMLAGAPHTMTAGLID